jgi:hypothetical protein
MCVEMSDRLVQGAALLAPPAASPSRHWRGRALLEVATMTAYLSVLFPLLWRKLPVQRVPRSEAGGGLSDSPGSPALPGPGPVAAIAHTLASAASGTPAMRSSALVAHDGLLQASVFQKQSSEMGTHTERAFSAVTFWWTPVAPSGFIAPDVCPGESREQICSGSFTEPANALTAGNSPYVPLPTKKALLLLQRKRYVLMEERNL